MPQELVDRELLDIKDLEQVLCFKRTKISELRDSGILPMTRIGKKWVITRGKLNDFLEKVDSGEIYINNELL